MGKTILRTPLVVQQGNVLFMGVWKLLKWTNSNPPLKNHGKLAAHLELNCNRYTASCNSSLHVAKSSWTYNYTYYTDLHLSLPGHSGQQVVTQIIRGQAVSTALSGTSPVATVTGQGVATAAGQAVGQMPLGVPRVPGQGQVKLTLAQLTQLTQVSEKCHISDDWWWIMGHVCHFSPKALYFGLDRRLWFTFPSLLRPS